MKYQDVRVGYRDVNQKLMRDYGEIGFRKNYAYLRLLSGEVRKYSSGGRKRHPRFLLICICSAGTPFGLIPIYLLICTAVGSALGLGAARALSPNSVLLLLCAGVLSVLSGYAVYLLGFRPSKVAFLYEGEGGRRNYGIFFSCHVPGMSVFGYA